ncbi:GILT-like protein 2 [Drosophila innubila]|uniref:GILT-like protein 2 n=1 Tax=Drosophila innubila TaxID=198719 RepID=UPI00148B4E94|nr:GILT-like protein 2 [Drosophila innubila]
MKTFVYWFALIFGILECTARRHHGSENDKLPVTLYYESLCPYCMAFVTEQLSPSMVHQDRLPYTELTLVPYGNAKKNSAGNVTCQHGVNECELNAWHACILEHHNISESLKLIACMMRGHKIRLDICANRYSIDVTAVKDCKMSRSLDDILEKYAEASDKVTYKGVPAITFDNVYDEDEQDNTSDNFDTVFCAKYEAKFNKKLQSCL